MTWNDAQACHMADLAGAIYARGIEEAPGHVATARAEYRQISRAWHSWLGFALYLGGRNLGLEQGGTSKQGQGSGGLGKRKALEELSSNQSRYFQGDINNPVF